MFDEPIDLAGNTGFQSEFGDVKDGVQDRGDQVFGAERIGGGLTCVAGRLTNDAATFESTAIEQ